jgi:GNAT superfamily N-acetyltransferase
MGEPSTGRNLTQMSRRASSVRELRDGDLARSRRHLRAIYESSFPAYERDEFEGIFGSLDGHRVWGAWVDSTLRGFADVLPVSKETALLRYLAVDKSARAQGVGSALLDAITRALDESFQRIVFEVESPDHAPDFGAAVKRLEFFDRWGAHEVRCVDGYFLPSTLDATERIPFLFFERHLLATACLAGDALKLVLRQIYDSYYGASLRELHLPELLSRVRC